MSFNRRFVIAALTFSIVSTVGGFLSAQESAKQDKVLDEFTEFLKAEIAKDDVIREQRKQEGAGLDLSQELASTRQSGLKTAISLVEKLKNADKDAFPGIASLVEQLETSGVLPDPAKDVALWKKIDADALTIRNPNFWKAYYEFAPGQGVLEALCGSLLKAEGQCVRSLQVSVIARMGNRKQGSLTSYHVANATQNQIVLNAANFRIGQGIEYFEKQDFEKASTTFKEILEDWPECGLASFELGLTIHHAKEHKAGREVKTQRLEKGDPALPTQETYDLWATARNFDPMLRNACQGTDTAKIVLISKAVLPTYRLFADFSNRTVTTSQLAKFGGGCQRIGLHDYALFTRHVYISTKDKFDPPDLAFIRKSLGALIDEESVEQIAKSLSVAELAQYSLTIKKPE